MFKPIAIALLAPCLEVTFLELELDPPNPP